MKYCSIDSVRLDVLAGADLYDVYTYATGLVRDLGAKKVVFRFNCVELVVEDGSSWDKFDAEYSLALKKLKEEGLCQKRVILCQW